MNENKVPRGKGQFLQVFKKEASLFKGRPVLWIAAAVIILIPSLYTLVYLGALWDPYDNLSNLPAGLVSLDMGTKFRGKNYNLGGKLVDELKKRKPFEFIEYPSEEKAEAAIRSGEVYFALVVPPDFSGKALPGSETGSLTLITSQGTSFIATIMAERFAREAANNINREIGVERWKVVLSSALAKGLHTLHADLAKLTAGRPAGNKTAEDMVTSVRVNEKELAPVSANGPGFAPYFMALSLWLSVLVSAFLFRLIVFPRSVAGKTKSAKLLGKGMIPLLISIAGAVLLGLTVQFVLKIPIVHRFGFYFVLLAAVLTYSTIILSLVRLIGDAGKLLAVLFLVMQIASASGSYPIELSPLFYRAISPYLPMTHVVGGLRASMFGSFDGEWARCMLFMLPWILVSLCLSFVSTRRFRYVDDSEYAPALDLSFK